MADENDPQITKPDKTGFTIQKAICVGILIVLGLQLYNLTHHRVAPSATPAQIAVSATTPSAATTTSEEVVVAFPVGGRITQMFFAQGATVKQGDLLATLDKAPFEEALAGAKLKLQQATDQYDNLSAAPNPNFSAIETARANVDAAQHVYENAHSELMQRKTQLVPGQQDNVYDNDVQNDHDAQSDVEKARRELAQQEAIGREQLGAEGYKAAIDMAKNDVRAAEAALADAQLVAPASGIVANRNAEIGTIVAANAAVYTLSVQKPATPAVP